MRNLLAVGATLLLATGCSEGHPESDPLRPGTSAVTVAKVIDTNRKLRSAPFHDGKAALGSLAPGIRVAIIFDPGYNQKKPVTNPDRGVKITVKSGAFRGVTGFVARSHLRPSK